jgi:hypothetical protein
MVGRVCPRHGHRGRPLNSVVRHHMNERRAEGVGTFHRHRDYWECVPDAIPDTTITIDTTDISSSQEELARAVCASWRDTIQRCRDYIESRRAEDAFESRHFTEPQVIIGESDWTVFFGTELELEASFGVEMRGDKPFQLVIGE